MDFPEHIDELRTLVVCMQRRTVTELRIPQTIVIQRRCLTPDAGVRSR